MAYTHNALLIALTTQWLSYLVTQWHPSKSQSACLTFAHVPHHSHPAPLRLICHLHPCPISPPSRSLDSCPTYSHISHLTSSPPPKSRYSCLTNIQVPIFAFHLHPGRLSPQSKFRKLYLSSIPIPSHPIHVSRCLPHPHQGLNSHLSRFSD